MKNCDFDDESALDLAKLYIHDYFDASGYMRYPRVTPRFFRGKYLTCFYEIKVEFMYFCYKYSGK